MEKKKTSRRKSDSSSDEPTFEESLSAIETILHQLESGNLGLSESLDAYEKGIGELKACYQKLDSAEQRVEILTGIDVDGNPIVKEDDAMSNSTKQSGRSSDDATKGS